MILAEEEEGGSSRSSSSSEAGTGEIVAEGEAEDRQGECGAVAAATPIRVNAVTATATAMATAASPTGTTKAEATTMDTTGAYAKVRVSSTRSVCTSRASSLRDEGTPSPAH